MKHLQRFNESKAFILSENIDMEYIEQCFISLIEDYDTHIDYESDDNENRTTWELIIYPDNFQKIAHEYDPDEIKNIREHLRDTDNILEQIEIAIDKIRIKYQGFTPAVSINYEYSNGNLGFYNPVDTICVMITEKCIIANNIS